MNGAEGVTAGSPAWQLVFLSCAVLIILLEILRGWRLGIFRQLIRVVAVIAAYAAAIFGGRLVAPVLRPVLTLPDFVLSAIAGTILALLAYFVVTGIGNVLFKRTGQQSTGIVRAFYGLSGAFVGILFGAFMVWLAVVSVRALGSVAEAQVKTQPGPAATARRPVPLPRSDETGIEPQLPAQREAPNQPLLISLARLKNSVELGSVGEAVKSADVVPDRAYTTLAKVGELLGRPEAAERFLAFPGAKEVTDHPKIVALREDPGIHEKIVQGRFFELMQNPRIIEAANDPTVVERVKKFDLAGALDNALKP